MRAESSKRQTTTLMITELFLPIKGGTAVWFDQVYPRIGGKEIHILTKAVPGGSDYDRTHANTVHRITLKRYNWLKPESLLIYLKMWLSACYLMLKHRIGYVHAGRVLPEGLIAVIVSALFRKPCLLYAHGEEITCWTGPIKRPLLRWLYQQADQVVANSEFTYQQLLKLGVREQRIHIIHPGVDLDRFKPNLAIDDLKQSIGLCDDEYLLLSVGRLSRRKGFDSMIHCLPLLRQAGLKVQYAIIGIGDDHEYLADLARQQGVEDQVHFLGHIAMSDLPRWYNACDLFVMPNRQVGNDTEGFGMVFIEAAACGKASIAGNSGGAPNAVQHGKTGIVINGNDTQALTDAICQVIENPTLRSQLASQGLERAQKQFSWDKIACETISIL